VCMSDFEFLVSNDLLSLSTESFKFL